MIPDQILQSVQSSRRTIIVLSTAYIESMWTKLEFRAAHTQALEDRCRRLILVVRDQLPPVDSLDPDLQKYISLNTYLDSADPWFWQKLRCNFVASRNIYKTLNLNNSFKHIIIAFKISFVSQGKVN